MPHFESNLGYFVGFMHDHARDGSKLARIVVIEVGFEIPQKLHYGILSIHKPRIFIALGDLVIILV